jgi:hypothetical protein
MKVSGCRKAGSLIRAKTYIATTTMVRNAMKSRGSRSTLEMFVEDRFCILTKLYIGFGILPLFERTVYERTASSLPESTLAAKVIPPYTEVVPNNKITSILKKGVCTMTTKTKSIGELITLVFKALALAMSVAAVVLNILGVASLQTLTLLLGFGLFCLAVTSLD